MAEMTKEDALAFYATEWWKECTDEEVARWQLHESKLCMPFGEFHRCVEATLGRPVYTHEFAKPELLRAELDGAPTPSLADIIAKLPHDKVLIVGMREVDSDA